MAAWIYEISLLVLKKRNFISPRGHVISSISLTLIHFILFHTSANFTPAIKVSTKSWISVSSGHFRLARIPLISQTTRDVDPWWRSKDEVTNWVISLGKTEESAKRDTWSKAKGTTWMTYEKVTILVKECNCRGRCAQALRSSSIATCTSASPAEFFIAAISVSPRADTTKLVPKEKGAAKVPRTDAAEATAEAAFTKEDVCRSGMFGRFLANSSNILLVFLLICIQQRKASCNSLRSLSNRWLLAVFKERISIFSE